MSTTVADLMILPIYRQNAKIYCAEGMENEVQYLTVMEAPDFHMSSLGKHVFILTTLSAYHDSVAQINQVIRGLCEAEAAAIAIKLGRFVNEIDASTIEIARNYKVPLVAFGSNVLFREVLADSLALISDNQRLIINQINELNREVFEAILQNCSLQKLIQLLCDKVACYGCCMDGAGKCLAKASSLKGELDRGALRQAIDYFYEQQGGGHHYLQREHVIIFPLSAQSELVGIFCIVLEEAKGMELVLPLAEAVVNALNVKFLERNLKLQTEREMMSSILDDVLFTEHSDETVIIDRLMLLNFKPQQYHMLAVLKWRDGNVMDYNSVYIVDVIQNMFAQRFDSVIVFTRGNRYIALLSYSNEKSPAAIAKTMQSCGETMEKVAHRPVDIGCSVPAKDFRQMPECYAQAKQAIHYGRMVHPEKFVYLYDDYFDMGLIARGLNSNAGDLFFSRIIHPIMTHDRKYKSELWPTLECCFSESTLEKAAAKLYIHVSTLRYRLQKIETLTGYNYFDIKSRMILYMACLLQKVSIREEQKN